MMKNSVKLWLTLGLFLVFMQVFIGGITRLTGSGLSITKWEIVTGTLPPMNSAQWQKEFDLYKATPQYKKINEGMTMSDFKFIYFWEYFHRLWARMMGFVFLIPFVYFLTKGWIDRDLRGKLLILVGLAAVVATFGWIMVASGLNERPWVSAYKLTWHLSLALVVYGYLSWLVYEAWFPEGRAWLVQYRRHILLFFALLVVQIMLGGIMSGAKAGIDFPTWPDMRGEWIPGVLFEASNWQWDNFIDYDKNLFFPALVQVLHRTTAYILYVVGIWLSVKLVKVEHRWARRTAWILGGLLTGQVFLGIWTVVECRGLIPVGLGISHQATAVLLLTMAVWLLYASAKRS